MEKKTMRTIITGAIVLILLALAVVGYKKTCNAAVVGWNTDRNGTFYMKSNGKLQQGFLKYKNNWYYFIPETGYMLTGWQWDDKGVAPIRYFNKKNGIMLTGWHTDSNGNKRYFDKSKGLMAKGWVKNASGQYRYFSKKNGIMAVGWNKNSSGQYRYFSKSSGVMFTGWVTTSEGTRFFDRNNGVMERNVTKWIDGAFHKFDAKGIDITKTSLN